MSTAPVDAQPSQHHKVRRGFVFVVSCLGAFLGCLVAGLLLNNTIRLIATTYNADNNLESGVTLKVFGKDIYDARLHHDDVRSRHGTLTFMVVGGFTLTGLIIGISAGLALRRRAVGKSTKVFYAILIILCGAILACPITLWAKGSFSPAPALILKETIDSANKLQFEEARANLAGASRKLYQTNLNDEYKMWSSVTRNASIKEVHIISEWNTGEVTAIEVEFEFNDGRKKTHLVPLEIENGRWRINEASMFLNSFSNSL